MNNSNLDVFNYSLFFFDAESIIGYGGILIIFLVVFGSNGLFFCFFLPTGALLFTAGIMTASGNLPHSIFTVCSLLILASVLGNLTGYWFGRKAGPLLYSRKDSKFFKQKHLKSAELFYRKYGWLALTIGLFLPIIRTFSPIVAGMVKLYIPRFVLLTITGSVLYIMSFVMAGYFIGSRPALKSWLNYIVIGFILIVTVPLTYRIIKEMRKKRS
jgi:membrane-associated protein